MPGDYTPNQFANALLRRLRIRPTRANTRALVGWEQAEGGHYHNTARFNPLNTTQNMPGSGDTGSQGNISVFRDWNQGVEATARTLNNGRYAAILRALHGNDPIAVGRAVQASPWGTKSDLILRTIGGAPGHPTGAIDAPASASPATSAPTAAPEGPSRVSKLIDTIQSMNASQAPKLSANTLQPETGTLAMAQAATDRLKQQQDQSLEMIKALSAAPEDTSVDEWSASQPTRGMAGAGGGGVSGEGAERAISWAQSKLGFKESGTNAGGIASYLNKQFGMTSAPWCAMFTSAAVTKGGAPAEARTAAVAEVRAKADAGQGYHKGVFSGSKAHRGDLIMWGNNHIALVTGRKGGKITYVGGNQSNGVTNGTVDGGSVDAVRPLYGARRRRG